MKLTDRQIWIVVIIAFLLVFACNSLMSCVTYRNAEYNKCTKGMAGYGNGHNFTKTTPTPR